MIKPPALFNCLIRTHHITSRKKLQRVRRAASQLDVNWLLIRSGGSPGLMFAESRDPAQLEEWVAAVQALRYKDFRCVAKPGLASERAEKVPDAVRERTDRVVLAAGFHETESTAEFGRELESRGLSAWWKKAMGYSSEG